MKKIYIFKNEKKGDNEKAPDYKMSVNAGDKFVDVGAGWVKAGKNGAYMSFSFKDDIFTTDTGTVYPSAKIMKDNREFKYFVLFTDKDDATKFSAQMSYKDETDEYVNIYFAKKAELVRMDGKTPFIGIELGDTSDVVLDYGQPVQPVQQQQPLQQAPVAQPVAQVQGNSNNFIPQTNTAETANDFNFNQAPVQPVAQLVQAEPNYPTEEVNPDEIPW